MTDSIVESEMITVMHGLGKYGVPLDSELEKGMIGMVKQFVAYAASHAVVFTPTAITTLDAWTSERSSAIGKICKHFIMLFSFELHSYHPPDPWLIDVDVVKNAITVYEWGRQNTN